MRGAVVVVLALLLQGCMWGRMKINDPDIVERAREIRVGETLGVDVPRILAAQPTMRMPGKDRLMYGYTYGDTKTEGIILLAFNFTRSSTLAETLYVEVDAKSDIVTNLYIPPERNLEWRFWPFGD